MPPQYLRSEQSILVVNLLLVSKLIVTVSVTAPGNLLAVLKYLPLRVLVQALSVVSVYNTSIMDCMI